MKKIFVILFFTICNYGFSQDINSKSVSNSTFPSSSGTVAATSDGNSRTQTQSNFTNTNSPNISGDHNSNKKSDAVMDASKTKKTTSGKK